MSRCPTCNRTLPMDHQREVKVIRSSILDRMSAGESQRALARRIGVSYETVRTVANGKHQGDMALGTYVKLFNALICPYRDAQKK